MKFRAFIAVEVEGNQQVRELAESLRRTKAPLKMVSLDNIHLTLKFLGDIEEETVPDIEKILVSAAQGVRQFELELHGVGVFPNLGHINVVWIGVYGADALKGVAEYIDEKLVEFGFEKEARGFTPHMTIARVKGGRNLDRLQMLVKENASTDFGKQRIEKLYLKKSVLTPKGPIYSTVSEVGFEQSASATPHPSGVGQTSR